MKKTFISLLLVILPFIGLFDAGYVTYEVFSGRVPVCRPPFQCATVLENQWAYIAGLPLSFYGFIFYAIVFSLAVMNFLEIKQKRIKDVRGTLRKLATFGFLFAIYVLFLMAFVIKAWCLWCLISAIILTIFFITSRSLTIAKESPTKEDL
ncbi:vitamin K epoxide reductase family protein [Patescibacteria group bacterium]|nr:vitamin K epoxide reductase family protein [Patescibacteria group bacterium]MBU1966955.1 vitamin K epoxide reductase family protein [Patescibacteria group bacterium]MBU2543302.1 vitamin K epoxide reductase family protein [Patescibacteria group bacterium]